jgi:hypothetical protein
MSARGLAAALLTVLAAGGCAVATAPPVSTDAAQDLAHAARAHTALRASIRVRAALARHVGLLPWSPAVTVGTHTAVWLARVPATAEPGITITMMRFDQRLVTLQLHAGAADPGGNWRLGSEIARAERHKLIASFNGAFKLKYAPAGFELEGHIVRPLIRGLASVVIYANGRTDIGAWGAGVPSGRSPVVAVRQNLALLIDHGIAASNIVSCVLKCWGSTVGLRLDVARSAVGITASGDLVWAAGEMLSVTALADALLAAGAVRAIELDINPWWIAGYLYVHHGSLTPIGLVPGERGIAGAMLTHHNPRDYFTIDAR